jgi:hypothetical protein
MMTVYRIVEAYQRFGEAFISWYNMETAGFLETLVSTYESRRVITRGQ